MESEKFNTSNNMSDFQKEITWTSPIYFFTIIKEVDCIECFVNNCFIHTGRAI